jgi:pimeloyl-ACP methyl ester carboxylesterase
MKAGNGPPATIQKDNKSSKNNKFVMAYISSKNGETLHYRATGNGAISIIFIHGWLGNTHWWDSQEKFLKEKYHIVSMDLGGHGKSDKTRAQYTAEQYVDDIRTIIHQTGNSRIILVGHSMSGAYALTAALDQPNVIAVILVDTLKDLDENFTPEQVEEMLFTHYRKDFNAAVKALLPQFLFTENTPTRVKDQLLEEFAQNDGEFAIKALKPLFEMDIRAIATQIKIPVRAINSDAQPTQIDHNRKYLKDFNYKIISGTGHYPMLEKPDEFNSLLDETLEELTEAKQQ